MHKLLLPAAGLLSLPLFAPAALGQAMPATDSVRATAAPPQTMFKLGLDAADAWGSWFGFQVPVYAGVERQLGRRFSLTGDVRQGFGVAQSRVQLAELRTSVGVRYYYGQARRQRLGKATAPFNGTYLQVQLSSNLERSGYFYGSDRPMYFTHQTSLEALWGWQRTFGKYSFIDAGAGLRLGQHHYYNAMGVGQNLRLEPYLRLRAGVRF